MISYNQIKEIYSWELPKIIFGIDAVEKVGIEAKQYGKKALIVTGKSIKKHGLLDRVTEPLQNENIEVDIYTSSPTKWEEPDLEEYNRVMTTSRRKKYDLVIAVGGGARMDMAKIAAIMAKNPGEIHQYLSEGETEYRDDLIKNPGLPTMMISTTHGAGAEIGHAIMLHIKKRTTQIKSPYIIPKVAVIDPSLTVTMPKSVTAATALDALATAIESYTTIHNTPLSDLLSLFAIKLVSENLRIAYGDGRNIEARYNLTLAGHIAGVANFVGAAHLIHAFSNAIGGMWRVPHGFACSVTIPYILDSLTKTTSKSRLNKLAQALCINTRRLTKDEVTEKIVQATKKLNEDVKSPTSLKNFGAKKEDIPEMVKQTLAWKHFIDRSPWKITYDEAIKLGERMLEFKI